MATKSQLVQQRLQLAEQAAAQGNLAAAANYAQAAANIQGSGQQRVQAVAAQYAAMVPSSTPTYPTWGDYYTDEEGNLPQQAPQGQPQTEPGGPAPAPAPSYTPPPAAFSAMAIMENLLRNALGVEGLGSWAVGLYNRGASPTEIIQALRYGTDTSDEGKAARARYLQAFPRIDEFIKDGIFAGENPELQYISYRNSVTEAAQRFGVNESLITKDRVASYIGNRVSASEIVDRMSQAATAVATTPVETLAVLRDYYGVQNGDLISFYLDPDTTEAILQKRYTAARIGTEAARQEFGIDVQLAENLAQRGVTPDEANRAFGQAARQSVFMIGPGETANRQALIGAQFGDQENIQQIERIAGSRVAEFQRGGGYVATREGIGGLSTASAP